MYNPAANLEDRVDVLHSFIREHPLAAIVTCGSNGPEATHVPVVLHTDRVSKGLLRFHFARANDHWKRMESSPVLAIFQGAGHYISPSWYPSKQEHRKVVPTWNYVTVHVRGCAKLFETHAELLEHLHALTNRNEAPFDKPWSVNDAPKEYIDALSKAIVGIELCVDSIEGKWKVSQNRSESDRQGVVAGLSALGSPESMEMARLVAERIPRNPAGH